MHSKHPYRTTRIVIETIDKGSAPGSYLVVPRHWPGDIVASIILEELRRVARAASACGSFGDGRHITQLHCVEVEVGLAVANGLPGLPRNRLGAGGAAYAEAALQAVLLRLAVNAGDGARD